MAHDPLLDNLRDMVAAGGGLQLLYPLVELRRGKAGDFYHMIIRVQDGKVVEIIADEGGDQAPPHDPDGSDLAWIGFFQEARRLAHLARQRRARRECEATAAERVGSEAKPPDSA